MTTVAREFGLDRESLYKALSEGSQPRFDTISKVINALGLKMSVHA
jgi:probable addiction module antidote protein